MTWRTLCIVIDKYQKTSCVKQRLKRLLLTGFVLFSVYSIYWYCFVDFAQHDGSIKTLCDYLCLLLNNFQICVKLPPPNKDHPVNKGHTSVILSWLNNTIKPPNKDHMSIKTMCCLSLGLPLFTGFVCIRIKYLSMEDR